MHCTFFLLKTFYKTSFSVHKRNKYKLFRFLRFIRIYVKKTAFYKKIRSKNYLLWNIKAIYEVSQNSNDLNYMNSLLSLKG